MRRYLFLKTIRYPGRIALYKGITVDNIKLNKNIKKLAKCHMTKNDNL